MKKLLVGAALVGICLSMMGAGIIPTPWNIPVTTSAWTAVTASQRVVEFQARSRSGQAFKISSESGGSPYYTVASDTTIQFDCPAARDAILFYIQTTKDSDTLEIFLLNK
jgi:hypothetical protein